MSRLPPPPKTYGWADPHAAPEGAQRAAVLLWVIGALEVLLACCCSFSFFVIATMPQAELLNQAPPNVRVEDLEKIYPWLKPLAMMFFVGGVIPGIAYLILGFGVQKARPVPTMIATIMTVTQSVVLGVIVLLQIVGALVVGDPVGLTVGVVVWGTPLAALITCAIWLIKLPASTRAEGDEWQSDPWDEED